MGKILTSYELFHWSEFTRRGFGLAAAITDEDGNRTPVDLETVVASHEALRAERDAAVAALTKINAVRSSIVAHQAVNFSEHVYPLVAALNEAGVEGQPYPEALAYYGPITERCARAEAERDALAEKVGRMRGALSFYADKGLWEGRPSKFTGAIITAASLDHGVVARAALADDGGRET